MRPFLTLAPPERNDAHFKSIHRRLNAVYTGQNVIDEMEDRGERTGCVDTRVEMTGVV